MRLQEPFELVLFGGLGDLALRKLLPALYMLKRNEQLGAGSVFFITRQSLSREHFVEKIRTALDQQVPTELWDENSWPNFLSMLHCLQLDVTVAEQYHTLQQAVNPDIRNRLFYLSTGSELYIPICQGLHQQGLIAHGKLVLEKPIGHDLASAEQICQQVSQYFTEEQVYRIDHYLGKETVQNLMVLRFANSIFEHQWNHKYIDHIQITISEKLGVEKRAGFYDQVGAMRDMLQNHLLQLLCITAMEPPARLDADSMRDEKVKVLKALKPLLGREISENIVCGQYGSGVSDDKPVPRYRDEPGVDNKSLTETYVAAKVEIENWRWAGVPFYLRTGKRMPERACEIVVYFKAIPHSIFPLQHKDSMANKLTFRLQPDEGIRLQLCEKRIGPGMNVRPMNMSLNPSNSRQVRVPEAYERLLLDALMGNKTLFLRDDELLEAWRWLDPILSYWQEAQQRPETYTAGSWGPAAATLLLARDGRLWDESN